MSKAHIGSALLLLFFVAQSTEAFEGDYIWDKRFKASLIKADSGQPGDQYAVGDMYFRGRGTTTNHLKALQWFLLAAEQGHRKAAYKTGYLYLYGEGFTPAPKQALHWFRRSATAGYVPAQYELGKLLLSESAGPRDNAQALKWLGKAKAASYAPAEAEFTQTVSRLLKPSKALSDVTFPSISLAALNKQRAQPTIARKPDFKHIILRSKWGSNDGPSTFLPSALTNCHENSAGIECVTAKLDRQSSSSTRPLHTRTKITDIDSDGQFRMVYANTVESSDASTAKANAQRTEHVLDCSLVAGRVISCAQGKQKPFRFFGRESSQK